MLDEHPNASSLQCTVSYTRVILTRASPAPNQQPRWRSHQHQSATTLTYPPTPLTNHPLSYAAPGSSRTRIFKTIFNGLFLFCFLGLVPFPRPVPLSYFLSLPLSLFFFFRYIVCLYLCLSGNSLSGPPLFFIMRDWVQTTCRRRPHIKPEKKSFEMENRFQQSCLELLIINTDSYVHVAVTS